MPDNQDSNPLDLPQTDLITPVNSKKPHKLHKPTLRQKKFVKFIQAGLSQSEAALAAGYSATSAANTTSKMMKDPHSVLHKTMSEYLDRAGLTDEALANKVVKLSNATKTHFFADKGIVTDQREVDALDIQKGAIDLAAKLKGHLVDRSLNVNINADVSPVDLGRYLNKK